MVNAQYKQKHLQQKQQYYCTFLMSHELCLTDGCFFSLPHVWSNILVDFSGQIFYFNKFKNTFVGFDW